MRGVYWNLWRLYDRRIGRWSYPSYVSWLAALVWNIYEAMGWRLPDRQWAYIVILGWRNRQVFNADAP